MPKPADLSDLSIDELTDLIDQATNLRTTKYEDRRRELINELTELKRRMEEPATAARTNQKRKRQRSASPGSRKRLPDD